MVRQIGQSYKTGRLALEDVAYPPLKPGALIVRTAFSVISIGTEGMKVREARMNLIEKARARPDQLKQVLDSVRQQGVRATYRKVMNRLDRLIPLGYSLSGYVVEVGDGASGFQVGQRVAAAGAEIANHGEYNLVPYNLAAGIPDGVQMDHAAFGTIGAIAMHALRQSKVTLGEVALVVGLGLIGQMLVRLLRAAGVHAIGIDPIAKRCTIAIAGGGAAAAAPDDSAWSNAVSRLSGGQGADVVLITTGTSDNAVIELAADAVRERGRIVVVGKTKLDLDYNTFFRKEIEVSFSRSYGPGRYDPAYEHDGVDYPYPYVRWTEKRNIESFLDLLAAGRIDLAPLIEIVREFDQAAAIYDEIDAGKTRAIGVLLDYGVRGPGDTQTARTIVGPHAGPAKRAIIGVLGAGNYAASMLLPPLKADQRVEVRAIVTTTGLSAANAARRFGAAVHGSDRAAVFGDPDVNGVVVATRHSSHAALTAEALSAGKAVMVEKPLAIDAEGLALVDTAVRETGNGRLMVGFNRRCAPIIRDLGAAMSGKGPFVLVYRVHAGALPRDAWQLSEAEGGRYIGEAGHFFDVFQFLTGSRAISVSAAGLAPARTTVDDRDNIAAIVTYADGSIATLVYATQGSPAIGKEYLEVHGAGMSAVMDNFTALTVHGPQNRKKQSKYGGEKGQAEQMRAFVDMIERGGAPPTPYGDLAETTRLTWLAAEAARARETRLLT